MRKLGQNKTAWKIQRALLVELPGLGKPGALERRSYPPGQHGQARRKFSEYGMRLREKQKVMFHYGLREEQLRRLVKVAKKSRGGEWFSVLAGMLETRLDNIVFRLGFAGSIAAARQLVRHGKVLVNGKRSTISSEMIKVGSEIALTETGYAGQVYQYSIKQPRLSLPDHLDLSGGDHKVGKLRNKPEMDAIPFPVDGQMIVEHYSKV